MRNSIALREAPAHNRMRVLGGVMLQLQSAFGVVALLVIAWVLSVWVSICAISVVMALWYAVSGAAEISRDILRGFT